MSGAAYAPHLAGDIDAEAETVYRLAPEGLALEALAAWYVALSPAHLFAALPVRCPACSGTGYESAAQFGRPSGCVLCSACGRLALYLEPTADPSRFKLTLRA